MLRKYMFQLTQYNTEQQYGFRKLHFTKIAAVKLVDYIGKQTESGNIPCNLYIDLSKAFDTLSYDIVFHKLKYYVFFWY